LACAGLLTAAGTAVAVLVVIAAGQPAGVRAAQQTTKLSPPVVDERFTKPLPCPDAKNPATTVEMKGCAQREILRIDKLIDALAKTIFSRLQGDGARRRFVKAQKAWFAYRQADCASVSDKFQGGTLAAVTALQCSAERNVQHVKEIRAFDRLLRTEGFSTNEATR